MFSSSVLHYLLVYSHRHCILNPSLHSLYYFCVFMCLKLLPFIIGLFFNLPNILPRMLIKIYSLGRCFIYIPLDVALYHILLLYYFHNCMLTRYHHIHIPLLYFIILYPYSYPLYYAIFYAIMLLPYPHTLIA